jgi:RimJ/RimL family protein N-acetyltransferase
MNIIPFEPEHVGQIAIQAQQMFTLSALPPKYLWGLKVMGPAITAEDNGKIIGCAGVAHIGSWMGTLWGFIAADAGPYFVRLHKCAKRLIEIPQVQRIEASSEVSFKPGCRWLELLGFEAEGVMKAYGIDGADHMRYARVRE